MTIAIICRCNNPHCSNVGNDMLLNNGSNTELPNCIVCGWTLSLLSGDIEDKDPGMPTIERVEPLGFEYNPDAFTEAGQDLADTIDADILKNVIALANDDPDPVNEVNEWMRCRDGIDKAEIALKGFCDEIGAEVTKSRIAELCRTLQDMIHTHYELGD